MDERKLAEHVGRENANQLNEVLRTANAQLSPAGGG
jgi:hypothetical protein